MVLVSIPMNDFGMVIFSHTLSLTSRPEVGLLSILAILYIGVVMVRRAASLSDSGTELVILGDELEVIVLRVGLPVNGRPYVYSPVREAKMRT